LLSSLSTGGGLLGTGALLPFDALNSAIAAFNFDPVKKKKKIGSLVV
jgi:hypothetical protein